MSIRTHSRWLLRILLALVLLAADTAFMPSPAFAQDQQRGVGILRNLFTPREPVRRVERRVVRPAARRDRQVRRERRAQRQPARARTRPAAAPQAAAPQAAAKLNDARTILVVGDFLAGGLAEGLETVFEQTPGVRIVDRSNGSSGFVRADFYDWPAEIGPILDAENPAAVVVMIGSNDRQEIDGQAILSPGWTTEYQSRIDEFTASITERNIPLVWVGMPAFKSSTMSSGMLAFNDIYRRAAESAPNGVFVDIWDGFVDENGNFVTHGPDVNGQSVQLRSSDGINMTKAGRRKVAFYVEKPLGRILGDTDLPEAEGMGPEMPQGHTIGALIPPEVNRTLPVSLDDPELDGGAELLGAAPTPAPSGGLTPAERLAVEGVALEPPPGRADDFLRRQPPEPAAEAGTEQQDEAGPVVQ